MLGPLVLVGSSDGFLYALKGCTLDLVWAKDLGAPVAEAVIGNVDADGSVEIVVGAADGYIYGLDWPPIGTPGSVVLGGAEKGKALAVAVGEDVTVSWEAAAGASGYEVALVDPDGRPLWSPAYMAVSGLSAVASLDGALASRPYRLVVRAKSGDQYSADVLSQPIVIVDTAAPSATARGASLQGEEAKIDIDGKDDLALDHYVIHWREADDLDGPILFLGDDLFSGKEASASFAFKLPASARGKNVAFGVDIVDSGGNVRHVTLYASVGKDGVIRFDPASGGPPIADGPSAADLAAGGGCALSADTRASGVGAFALAASLGAGLALARRRRRRSL
jgi:hypothetical protein